MPAMPILDGAAALAWLRNAAEHGIDEEARAAVAPILEAVRERGDAALRQFTQRYDGVSVDELRASDEERALALSSLPTARRKWLELAANNLRLVHEAQLRTEGRVSVAAGVEVWREFRAIEVIGIYVPGGRASYPSTVLMCGVPARLAGCRRVVVCVPPAADGRAPTPVLAAAELLSIDEVYIVGGAQAVAAMAFGTESVPRVDKIFGPGNRYVTAAKELVYGAVDIDMPAGPSEIVVLADESAEPRWVAADLISQAEHAPDTLAVAITVGHELAARVEGEVGRQLRTLPRPEVAAESLAGSAICVAPALDTAIEWVNLLAAEHLTIVTHDGESTVARIENAGSVFVGGYSPVAAGDYAVGSNHVLPTGARARAWSALSVDDFGRWMQVQRLTGEGLAELADCVAGLARWEGFEAHARAAEIRFEEEA